MFKSVVRFPKFLKEVKEELKKVKWSSRQESTEAAILVVIASSILTVYIAAVDLGLSRLVQFFIK